MHHPPLCSGARNSSTRKDISAKPAAEHAWFVPRLDTVDELLEWPTKQLSCKIFVKIGILAHADTGSPGPKPGLTVAWNSSERLHPGAARERLHLETGLYEGTSDTSIAADMHAPRGNFCSARSTHRLQSRRRRTCCRCQACQVGQSHPNHARTVSCNQAWRGCKLCTSELNARPRTWSAPKSYDSARLHESIVIRRAE